MTGGKDEQRGKVGHIHRGGSQCVDMHCNVLRGV